MALPWVFPRRMCPRASPQTFTLSIFFHETLLEYFSTRYSEFALLLPQAPAFTTYLATLTRQPTKALPLLISLESPLLEYPFSHPPPHLISNLEKLLRKHLDVRHLSSSILHALFTTYSLHLSLQSLIQTNKFFSAHLRTGPDAVAAS
ncbi:hypothetical protein BDZ45DRAFT_745429 [Acephala macrosclerotiorum]|nr:hypothetical protein BDZ45DRAFT_745429 [Acephala macrosclerotiorum]